MKVDLEKDYSTLSLPMSTSLFELAASAAKISPHSLGVDVLAMLPTKLSLLINAGSCSTFFKAAFNALITVCGVPTGANKPVVVLACKGELVSSLKVGTKGNAVSRSGDSTARTRNLPESIKDFELVI